MQLAWASKASLRDDRRVTIANADGQRRTMKPGGTLALKPGQDACLPPRLCHRFWVERAFVLGWEISIVNGDQHDNYSLEPGGHFPAIEEDEPVKRSLCSEYGILR